MGTNYHFDGHNAARAKKPQGRNGPLFYGASLRSVTCSGQALKVVPWHVFRCGGERVGPLHGVEKRAFPHWESGPGTRYLRVDFSGNWFEKRLVRALASCCGVNLACGQFFGGGFSAGPGASGPRNPKWLGWGRGPEGPLFYRASLREVRLVSCLGTKPSSYPDKTAAGRGPSFPPWSPKSGDQDGAPEVVGRKSKKGSGYRRSPSLFLFPIPYWLFPVSYATISSVRISSLRTVSFSTRSVRTS